MIQVNVAIGVVRLGRTDFEKLLCGLATNEAFKLLNEQSDNRQQAPMQPFMVGPDPSQSYYANMRALGETPSGGNPFEQS